MSKEIQLTTTLNWKKGGMVAGMTTTETIDQEGKTAIENVQVISPDVSEAIDFGDVTDPIVILFKNLVPKWISVDANGSTKEVYNAANQVYVGLVNPATAVNAEFSLSPQQGATVLTGQPAWYAIGTEGGDPIELLVVAIQR